MTNSTHSNTMKNMLAMGKLAAMVNSLTSSVMENNPVSVIRLILANNNGSIGIASLASELNRRLNVPEGLDTQAACIRTIMSMANDPSAFYKVEGETVKYIITSSREKLWRTAASFEAFAKYADKNKGFPHPAVDSAVNDLKVFMRSNTHAMQVVDAVTGNVPKQIATVAFSVVVAALIPAPNSGDLPTWLSTRAEKMIAVEDMDVLERITCSMVNMQAVFIDGLSAKQPSIVEGLDHTQINLMAFYERIPAIMEQIRELLSGPNQNATAPAASTPKEVQSPAPAMNTTHVGAGIPLEPEQKQSELPINVVEVEEGLTDEQSYRVRGELMTAYREMVADMCDYVSGYHNETGVTAIDHIRKVARLGLKLDLSEHADDALESFMLFGNPDSVDTNMYGALMLASHLRIATRMAYIFN